MHPECEHQQEQEQEEEQEHEQEQEVGVKEIVGTCGISDVNIEEATLP